MSGSYADLRRHHQRDLPGLRRRFRCPTERRHGANRNPQNPSRQDGSVPVPGVQSPRGCESGVAGRVGRALGNPVPRSVVSALERAAFSCTRSILVARPSRSARRASRVMFRPAGFEANAAMESGPSTLPLLPVRTALSPDVHLQATPSRRQCARLARQRGDHSSRALRERDEGCSSHVDDLERGVSGAFTVSAPDTVLATAVDRRRGRPSRRASTARMCARGLPCDRASFLRVLARRDAERRTTGLVAGSVFGHVRNNRVRDLDQIRRRNPQRVGV